MGEHHSNLKLFCRRGQSLQDPTNMLHDTYNELETKSSRTSDYQKYEHQSKPLMFVNLITHVLLNIFTLEVESPSAPDAL